MAESTDIGSHGPGPSVEQHGEPERALVAPAVQNDIADRYDMYLYAVRKAERDGRWREFRNMTPDECAQEMSREFSILNMKPKEGIVVMVPTDCGYMSHVTYAFWGETTKRNLREAYRVLSAVTSSGTVVPLEVDYVGAKSVYFKGSLPHYNNDRRPHTELWGHGNNAERVYIECATGERSVVRISPAGAYIVVDGVHLVFADVSAIPEA